MAPDDPANIVWEAAWRTVNCIAAIAPIVMALLLNCSHIFSLVSVTFVRVRQSPGKLLHPMTV